MGYLPEIAERLTAGETLRALAAEYDISYDSLRQALKRAGYSTSKPPMPAAVPRRIRRHRVPGGGRPVLITPAEAAEFLQRHRASESIRSLARASGVSHETMRRVLAEAEVSIVQIASA